MSDLVELHPTPVCFTNSTFFFSSWKDPAQPAWIAQWKQGLQRTIWICGLCVQQPMWFWKTKQKKVLDDQYLWQNKFPQRTLGFPLCVKVWEETQDTNIDLKKKKKKKRTSNYQNLLKHMPIAHTNTHTSNIHTHIYTGHVVVVLLPQRLQQLSVC